ncbi:MAG TPA: hypothetical protein VKU02_24415 [Gemmataceae bacterium]|nr:hypothetical protein [Gemmataceae bacterium]
MMRSTGSHNTKIIDRSRSDGAQRDAPRQIVCWADPIVAATHRFSHVRRPLLLPGIELPPRPGLLLLTALLLGLFCLVMTIPRHPPSEAAGEFALLSDLSSSNLNNTSAEAPHQVAVPQTGEGSSDTTPSAPAAPGSPPVLQVPELLAAPTPEPVPLSPAEFTRPPATEETLAILPAAVLEPVRQDCYPIRDPHQGDTPMMRTWKRLGLNAFLAALFAATPAPGSTTAGPPSDSEKLEEIQRQLNEVKTALAEIKKTLTENRTDSNLGTQKIQSQISELHTQVVPLLDSLRNRATPSTRIAASPPSDTGLGTPTARIEMANTYSQPVSIVINNRRSYALQPGERRLSDPVPAGSFTYEILGVTPIVTRTVAADKVFTLWVHPQP